MITIQLTSEAGCWPADTRQELVLAALATALAAVNDSCPPAWTVLPLPGDAPFCYALLPLPGSNPSAAAVWAMTYTLRSQPHIAAAEPWCA